MAFSGDVPVAMETRKEEARQTSLPDLPPLYSAVSFGPALSRLHKQRKETAALRNLFYSLAERRQKKEQDTRFPVKQNTNVHRARRASSDNDGSSGHASTKHTHGFPKAHAGPRHPKTLGAKQDAGVNSQSLPSISAPQDMKGEGQQPPFSSTTGASPKPSPKTQQTRRASLNRLRRIEVSRSLFSYHTGIMRRPAGTCSPRFSALTQLCNRPLPQLTEGLTRSCTTRPASTRDLQTWQNEIVKMVPSRPGFVLPLAPSDGSYQVQFFRYPYKVSSWHPTSHFYRSWSKVTDKDYVISPEWSSEKRLLRSAMRCSGVGKGKVPAA